MAKSVMLTFIDRIFVAVGSINQTDSAAERTALDPSVNSGKETHKSSSTEGHRLSGKAVGIAAVVPILVAYISKFFSRDTESTDENQSLYDQVKEKLQKFTDSAAEKKDEWFGLLKQKSEEMVNKDEASVKPPKTLGSISTRFESGKEGPAAVGWDSTGGTSYGTYQFSSKQGTYQRFLSYLDHERPDWSFKLKRAGRPDSGKNGPVAKAWKEIAAEGGEEFARLQHEFARKEFYDPTIRSLVRFGIPVSSLSPRFHEAVWSTAIQHGPTTASRIIKKSAKKVGTQNENLLIKEIYEERKKRFGSSTRAIRESVHRRLELESNLLLEPASTRVASTPKSNTIAATEEYTPPPRIERKQVSQTAELTEDQLALIPYMEQIEESEHNFIRSRKANRLMRVG